LPLTQQAQESIEAVCREQEPLFFGDNDREIERVPFDPTYRTDEETVLCIEGFELPPHIADAVSIPEEVARFEAGTEAGAVKSAFHVGAGGRIYFQCWRNIEVLGRSKLWLMLSGQTFDIERKTPLVLERKLDAIYDDGTLLFKSTPTTSAMLGLLNHVAAATDEDIQAFVSDSMFTGDFNEISARCSHLQRRQIRLLIQSGQLAEQTVENLSAAAEEVGYDLPVDGGMIVIPPRGLALSELLSFLTERIYRAPFSGDSMVAGSARKRRRT
jgi:hypothetical protein